jgi:hypothetical protein
MVGGQREQPPAPVPLSQDRGGQIFSPSGPDLDLGGDQLAGDGIGENWVLAAGRGRQLLEALD